MSAKVYLKSGETIEYERVIRVYPCKDGTINIKYRVKSEIKLAVFLLENIVGFEW